MELKDYYTLSELSKLIWKSKDIIRRYKRLEIIKWEYQNWKFWKELIFSKLEIEKLIKEKNIKVIGDIKNDNSSTELQETIIKEKDNQILKLQWVINQVQSSKDELINEKNNLINERVKLLENWEKKDKEKERLKKKVEVRNYILLILFMIIVFLLMVSFNILKIEL